MVALDTNTNGVLEASEIANAPTALLALDADKDGKLSQAELMPPPPPGAPQRPAPPEGMRHPVSPLMKALDSNADGELDATEIANASTSLLTLDKNGDGQLTPDELRPDRPGGHGPDGGPGGPPPDGAPAGPPPQDQ